MQDSLGCLWSLRRAPPPALVSARLLQSKRPVGTAAFPASSAGLSGIAVCSDHNSTAQYLSLTVHILLSRLWDEFILLFCYKCASRCKRSLVMKFKERITDAGSDAHEFILHPWTNRLFMVVVDSLTWVFCKQLKQNSYNLFLLNLKKNTLEFEYRCWIKQSMSHIHLVFLSCHVTSLSCHLINFSTGVTWHSGRPAISSSNLALSRLCD